MTRPLRIHAPGLIHHVFVRGDDKKRIFADDEDCETFLELLAEALPRFNVCCAAYCLLWNHYHLLLVPHEHRLSRLMQQVNSAYCQQFNRRHKRVGHVLQGRFGQRIIDDGAYAMTVFRYLALNPVVAKLADAAAEWRWSSYRAAAGLAEVPDFLCLDHLWNAFGARDTLGRERFASFVDAGIEDDFPNPLVHGSGPLKEFVAPLLKPHHATRDYTYAHRYCARPSLEELLAGRKDPVGVEAAIQDAFHVHAYTLAEIASALGKDPSTICRWIKKASAGCATGDGLQPRRQETRSDPEPKP